MRAISDKEGRRESRMIDQTQRFLHVCEDPNGIAARHEVARIKKRRDRQQNALAPNDNSPGVWLPLQEIVELCGEGRD